MIQDELTQAVEMGVISFDMSTRVGMEIDHLRRELSNANGDVEQLKAIAVELRLQLAQTREELEYSEKSRRHIEDDFSMASVGLDRIMIELTQARIDIASKDRLIELLQAQIEALKSLDTLGRLFQIADALDAHDKACTP